MSNGWDPAIINCPEQHLACRLRSRFRLACCILLCYLGLQSSTGIAAELSIAVAANFKPTFRQLAEEFARSTSVRVHHSSASTGTLYAQIIFGAPFDLFLSADSRRPELLAEQRLGLPQSRFTYAMGQLILWVPGQAKPGAQSLTNNQHRLAIANPATAPYGVAARQLLQKLDLWERSSLQLIRGNSVGQAFQFVVSGNVTAGLVAYSQFLDYRGSGDPGDGIWLIPHSYYQPIEQQAIILKTSNPAAADFMEFLKSPAGRGIITANGYLVP